MWQVNVEKCLKIFEKVYVSSDDIEILHQAWTLGAIPIERGEELCGDTPNIPVYQHALERMGDVDAIVAVQANSPTVHPRLIDLIKGIAEMGVHEIMTMHPDHSIYGSVWALSAIKLRTYGDPYKPEPWVLLVDNSVDIHTEEDYQEALRQYSLQK